ncbi:replication initiation protein [Clostridium carnis]
MKDDYLVTKSNKLIACNYDLSLQEQKIILTLASMVQPNDIEFKEYAFKIKEFMELLNIKDKSKYVEVPKITKELMKKVLEIKEGNDLVQFSWLSSARYKTGEGIVILKFDSSLKPYMLELKELYTSYKLSNILTLKSKYSIRIYELLKSNLYRKVIEFNIEDLKDMVGAKEKSYNVYQNFKNKVIIKAQKELKEKTDIQFEFEEIKTGRKVTSLKFYIRSNKVKNLNADNIINPMDEVSATIIEKYYSDDISEVKNIIEKFCGKKINIKTANDFYNLAKRNEVHKDQPLKLIKEIAEYSTTQNIKNLNAWFKTMLKDYEKPLQSVKQLKFNNFKGRDYDYDILEKKLLGWED